MRDSSDMELVRDYARLNSEAAFAELVQRHINLAYSAALRHVGNAAHAEEITQAVFIILARKAASLRPDCILEGWLHETTRLTALSFMRGERRRQFREQEAYMQSTLQESTDVSAWNQVAPLLDEAMSRLGKKDRDAVMLRFFKDKSLREVAAALRVNEAAAQRRVHRAVEKLRGFFTKRGIVLPTAVLTAAISANSVQAAPAMLAKTATAVAFAKGATASASTLTLIKGELKIMAWTKAKTAVVAGVVVLLAAGTTIVTVKEIQEHRTFPIVPGQSVGKVHKGMTAEQVEAVLGKAEQAPGAGDRWMTYVKHYGLEVSFDNEKGVRAVFCRGLLPNFPNVKAFKGKTKEGIGIESSRADIIKAYGEPTSATILDRPSDGSCESLAYKQLGLEFSLLKGRLFDIVVDSAPNPAPAAYPGDWIWRKIDNNIKY